MTVVIIETHIGVRVAPLTELVISPFPFSTTETSRPAVFILLFFINFDTETGLSAHYIPNFCRLFVGFEESPSENSNGNEDLLLNNTHLDSDVSVFCSAISIHSFGKRFFFTKKKKLCSFSNFVIKK